MSVEQLVIADRNTVSPTRSPKAKRRLVVIEEQTTSDITLEESVEIRKLFLTPFLQYQAHMASENISLKLSVEKIRELKKIACPVDDMHIPFRSRKEALDVMSGRYMALTRELQAFAAHPQSAERQLITEIQKIYSAYVQSCIAHDEKAAQARHTTNEQRITAERNARERSHQLEEAQHLAEVKTQLSQIIASRKILLTQKLEQLNAAVVECASYSDMYTFIRGLTHSQKIMLREMAPGLPLETNDLQLIINKQIEDHRSYFQKELKELQTIEADFDNHSLATVHTLILNIQGKRPIPELDLGTTINDLSQQFVALKPNLSQKVSEISRSIDNSLHTINQQIPEINKKYQHKKQDRIELMNRSYQRLSRSLSESKVQAIRHIMGGMVRSDEQLDKNAADLAKRWWDSLPLINILPPVKKAYIDRKYFIRSEFAEIKRNKIQHDAYASIADAIPQAISREHSSIDFSKIKNAVSTIEQTRLVVLPNEKEELLKLEEGMGAIQRYINSQKEVSGLLTYLQKRADHDPIQRLNNI